MSKLKQRTSTIWDPAIQNWRLKANIHPFNTKLPSEYIDIKDENGLPIIIKENIDFMINNFFSKSIFKKVIYDADTIFAITFTRGHHPSIAGYWTDQTIGLLKRSQACNASPRRQA